MGRDKENRRGGIGRLADAFMIFDQFGKDVGFSVSKGKRVQNSCLGALLSLWIYTLLFVYALSILEDMSSHLNTQFVESIEKDGTRGGVQVPYADALVAFLLFKHDGDKIVNLDDRLVKVNMANLAYDLETGDLRLDYYEHGPCQEEQYSRLRFNEEESAAIRAGGEFTRCMKPDDEKKIML